MKLVIWLACMCKICHAIQNSVPVYKLLDGNQMPKVGFGTFLMTPDQIDGAVISALENGYRYIDTAFMYQNEKNIGDTLKKWFAKGNKRKDVFITTKLPCQAMRAMDVEKVLDISLKNLGLDYVDMYLLHMPFGLKRTADFQELKNENGTNVIDFTTNHHAIWRALEKQVKVGKVKSIGLSNFNATQLLRIWDIAKIKPSNLQVESNVYLQQVELRELCQQRGIVYSGYSPLGSGGLYYTSRNRKTLILPTPMKNTVVIAIAKAHNKSAAQVLLRFSLQTNIVVLVKSTQPQRIKENIDIFDFELTNEEMVKLKSLDRHGAYRKFDFLVYKGIEHHSEYPFTDKIPKQRSTVSGQKKCDLHRSI